jgi:hypothetical protein
MADPFDYPDDAEIAAAALRIARRRLGETVETPVPKCALCGHEKPFEGCGYAGVTEGETRIVLCHSEEHDCYRLWTVYGRRPSPERGTHVV